MPRKRFGIGFTRRGGGATWTPALLPDLAVFLEDSSDTDFFTTAGGSTPTANGGNVNDWRHISPTTIDLTNTLVNPGTLRTGVLNGWAAVEVAANTTLTAEPLTIFRGNWYAALVCTTTATSASQFALSISDSSQFFYLFPREDLGGGNIQTRFGSTVTGAGTIAGDVGAGYTIYELGFDGTNLRLRINGGSWTTVSSAALTGADRVGLGFLRRTTNVSFCPGRYAHLSMVNAWPSDANLTLNLAYLRSRFAL